MPTEMEKVGALRGNRGPETPVRTPDEQDVEVVFKEQVRRILGKREKSAKGFFNFYADILRERRRPSPSYINVSIYEGLHAAHGTKVFFGEFENKPEHIVPSGLPRRIQYESHGLAIRTVSVPHDKEKEDLETKIQLLEHQLQCDRSHLQLFRLGAASLLISLLSILFWRITGVGAPLHPVFAAVVVPISAGLMAMAFLIRSGKSEKKPKRST